MGRQGVLAYYKHQANRKGWYGEVGKKVYNYLLTLLNDPCVYCGELGCNTFDHIIPKSEGGGNGWTNLAPCHSSCNYNKRSKGVLECLAGQVTRASST